MWAFLAINLLFTAIGGSYVYFDEGIPYWDLKLHVKNSFELIEASRQLDIRRAIGLLSDIRAPGIIVPLLPVFLFLPVSLDFLQFFVFFFYANLFVAGTALLGRAVLPRHGSFWFIVLPALCPLLWWLGLKPYFDIGPLALTPWLLYAALKADYFQSKAGSAFLGVVLALEVVFRSYGAYIIVVFGFSYALFFAEEAVRRGMKGQWPRNSFSRGAAGVVIAAAIFVTLACIQLSGMYKVISLDIGSASHLWGSADRLYYLDALLTRSLGGVLLLLAFLGVPFLLASPASRLALYFGIFFLIVFQGVVANKDPRYAGALAALAVFSAAVFLTRFSGFIGKRMARPAMKITAALLVALLLHQLVYHVLPAHKGRLSSALAQAFRYPDEPLYKYAGNQPDIVGDLFARMDALGKERASIYVGKDRYEFNYEYLRWVKESTESLREKDRPIFHSDVLRYHGVPVNFFDIDFVLLGPSASEFNKEMLAHGEGAGLLKNYRLIKTYPLALHDRKETLLLLARERGLDLEEQIAAQQSVISLAPDNLHNLAQLLWLYKLKTVNLNRSDDELGRIAELVPAVFGKSNIEFERLKPLSGLSEYAPVNNEFIKFFSGRGVYITGARGHHELKPDRYDDDYSFEWMFMINESGFWTPLVKHSREGEEWKDGRKWGSFLSQNGIDYRNNFNVIDKPLGVFWTAPRTREYDFRVSVTAEDPAGEGDVELLLNNDTLDVHCNGRPEGDCEFRLHLEKNDVFGLVFKGRNSYNPRIHISRVED